MNVLLRVTSCRVLEKMRRDPEYAKLIGLTDASQMKAHQEDKAEGKESERV